MIRNSAIAEKWAQRILDCRESGMSIKKWCNQQGLKDSTYHYWVKKLKTSHNKDKVACQQFAEIVLEDTNNRKSLVLQTTGYKLSLNYGDYSIGIADDFNPSTLAELLKVLKKL
ncbi:IS66 family insertion sequence element accessory protein TnpA [Crassaminicella profunda]|uniref:IS66 family insertion sequence element accessory protein TnpA n=1 Tax=Crassaminicella profunda TaxID=1286698 RepID=UPI001CA5FE06|nr:hypothetical protein [Crassaminicella profunda]QZY57179.1 hypothetical protein K7H06_09775 [Crassaminicella profunda]